jgi:hypothetical protein
MVMKDAIIEQCLLILRREDVNREIKRMITPLIELILIEIYPYLYISLIFVIISFLLHLGTFILLLRNKFFFFK